jgi:hypothetical protein
VNVAMPQRRGGYVLTYAIRFMPASPLEVG